MLEPEQTPGQINFLSVGTQILLKNSMEQYLRTLGDHKTFYASNLQSALRMFAENPVHILLSEVSLSDGSAYRLFEQLGGNTDEEDVYFVLALEDHSPEVLALADEMEVHDHLIRPISAQSLKALMDRYTAWRAMPKEPWRLLIQDAHMAERERRYQDAERIFLDIAKIATDAKPLYKAGHYFLKKPNLGMAQKLFEKALSMKPNCARALSGLGTVCFLSGDHKKAEEFWLKCNTISPLNPERPIELLKLNTRKGIDLCRRMKTLDPGNPMGRLQMGKFQILEKDYSSAFKELDALLKDTSDVTLRNEIQMYMAVCKKMMGVSV